MCAAEDRKAFAVIRDTAMVLFGRRGLAAVSIREIAAAAGVSPSLVVHHFGSKEGLKEAIDRRVVDFVDVCLEELAAVGEESATSSFAELWAQRLEQRPGLTEYVGRLLVDGGPTAEALFDRLFDATLRGITGLAGAGVLRTTSDERVLASFLLVNDLAVVLLRAQVTRVLRVDPLGEGGLARWCAVCADVYAHGLLPAPRSAGSTGERGAKG